MSVQKIKDYLQEYSYLKSIEALLHWDMETMMPAGAIDDRAKRMSYIRGKVHGHITAKKYATLVKDLAKAKLTSLEKKLQRELAYDLSIMQALPMKHVLELSEAQTHATHAWAKARKQNNWKDFQPHLQNLIDLKRRETSYFKAKKPYDALIKLHDKEFTSDEITKLFKDLRGGLQKLAGKVKSDGKFVKVKDLPGPFPIEAQRRISLEVARLFGLPEANSRLDISAHPFSINISPLDQRITTRYDEAHLDSLSSTMHEVGHALYELNLPREWEGTPLQEACSLSVHESQSRFWENVIGRSREFCGYLHPILKREFPKAMKGVDEETLYRFFNKSVPGLIRVESSELYYNLHVIIRYEIEEMIFNQGLDSEELPAIWNKKYQEYLGLKPKTFAEGILQDSHWSGAAFGYFPTYTLGNLISGNLRKQMKKSIASFDKDIAKADFTRIRKYLVDHIHSKGRATTAREIVGELDVKVYLDYLAEKFNV